MANERYRLMYKFWLDVKREDEEVIADIIERLKSARAFSASIRNGLRLVWDLGQGNVDVLLELFPFVKGALAGSGGEGISKADFERLEQLIKEARQGQPIAASDMLKSLGGLKPVAAPVYDEEDDEMILPVSKAEGGGNDATMNFLNSLTAASNYKAKSAGS